jgi:hypothetical protein
MPCDHLLKKIIIYKRVRIESISISIQPLQSPAFLQSNVRSFVYLYTVYMYIYMIIYHIYDTIMTMIIMAMCCTVSRSRKLQNDFAFVTDMQYQHTVQYYSTVARDYV